MVSASRSEQRSFDAPGAVQLVDRDTIASSGPQVNLSESLNRVSGLTVLNRQNYAQDLQVSIRGFGARSSFGIRGVRLLVDGIPATTPDGQGQGSSISLTSTDRIEVLKGPLAQLYGNSSGGVIQAFTRDPGDQPEFAAQYYLGSDGMRRSDWQYLGRVGDYRLVADYCTFDTDGFRDNSRTERRQFNGKLGFNPSQATRVNLVVNHFDMPLAQDPLGLTAAQLAANPAQAGTNAISRAVRKTVLQNQVGTSVVHSLDPDRSVAARLYYGTRDNLQYQTGLAASPGAWVGLNRNYYGAGLQYNQRAQIDGHAVNWVVGYEYDRSRENRRGGVATLGEKTSTTRSEKNLASNSDLFLQMTARLAEQWSMVTGLRYSAVRLSSSDEYPSDGDGSGGASFTATNPVLGLTYHASSTLNLYANVGKGFESPTLAEVAYSGGGTPAFNQSLIAARSRHYELGAKWMPSPRTRFDFTLFQIDSTDEIVVATSTGGNSTFKNAPGTNRTGYELSGSVLLLPNLKATLAASAIDAHFSQTFTSGASTVAAGNKIPGIPQHFVFSELLWTGRDAAAGSKVAAVLGAQAGLELVHAGALYANDSNSAQADGYAVANASLRYGWALGAGSLVVSARVDNLTDRRYVGSVIVNQASSQFYEPAPGRSKSLGLRLTMPL